MMTKQIEVRGTVMRWARQHAGLGLDDVENARILSADMMRVIEAEEVFYLSVPTLFSLSELYDLSPAVLMRFEPPKQTPISFHQSINQPDARVGRMAGLLQQCKRFLQSTPEVIGSKEHDAERRHLIRAIIKELADVEFPSPSIRAD